MESRLTKAFIIVSIYMAFLTSSCIKRQAFSAYDIKLNTSIQENFASGERDDRIEFQYGQKPDKAVDIVQPIDPRGIRSIARAHNYYISKGSKVKFNFETLIQYETYELNDDIEKHGKLKIPLQWMSICTFKDPIQGKPLKRVDGDEAVIIFNLEENIDVFSSYLIQCKLTPTNHENRTAGGPLVNDCERFELGGANDPFNGQRLERYEAYPLCFFDAEFTVNDNSTFYNEIQVSSYNDSTISWDDRTFTSTISPTFFVLDDTVTTYSITMTPDPDNGTDTFLIYNSTVFQEDDNEKEIWPANFASDISIAYMRFFWTDHHGNRFPIVHEPQLVGPLPLPLVQINDGDVCYIVDGDGFVRADDCILFASYSPTTPKADLNTPINWKLKVFYDEYNYELAAHWGMPVIMEFGIKAD